MNCEQASLDASLSEGWKHSGPTLAVFCTWLYYLTISVFYMNLNRATRAKSVIYYQMVQKYVDEENMTVCTQNYNLKKAPME